MSSFSIVHDVSQELRQQIFAALDSAPDVDFSLTSAAANISLSPPNDISDSSVLASLYLYHVDIDRHLRNQRPLPDPGRADAFRLPPLPLQLRYLLTPVDDDELNNQLLLGRVIQLFHDAPIVSALGGAGIGDSFGGASAELRVRPDLLSMEQLSQVWSAFSTPYRLSVTLLVEVVAVDSALPPRRQPRVSEKVVATGLKEREDG
ncbi:DUF4255 domain-containing protein [Fluviibacterium sp. DFM31]|uniref:DUF4255 domain-containing protein n=1 Tax=Meridianimarinicoccus marinus TaxID=3231483 RepID=A0ABV3L7C9_9RHOB